METGRRVERSELQLLDIKVTKEGGSVRYLEGAKHGLLLSLFEGEIVPGGGPGAHSHPYVEIFVVHEGSGRFTVGEDTFDGVPGDVIIVPTGMPHDFVNTGEVMLRQTSIHQAPVQRIDPVS